MKVTRATNGKCLAYHVCVATPYQPIEFLPCFEHPAPCVRTDSNAAAGALESDGKVSGDFQLNCYGSNPGNGNL